MDFSNNFRASSGNKNPMRIGDDMFKGEESRSLSILETLTEVGSNAALNFLFSFLRRSWLSGTKYCTSYGTKTFIIFFFHCF